jgi:hypothetical protein
VGIFFIKELAFLNVHSFIMQMALGFVIDAMVFVRHALENINV